VLLVLTEKVEFILQFFLIVILAKELTALVLGPFLPSIEVDTFMEHQHELNNLFVILLMH